jgi:glutamate synthase domain-containing protein 1
MLVSLCERKEDALNRGFRIHDGCGVAGIHNEKGRRIPGSKIRKALDAMLPRYNGLGAGYAGYGIYPRYPDCYAIHLILDDEDSLRKAGDLLSGSVNIQREEEIPTRSHILEDAPLLRRFFVKPPERTRGLPIEDPDSYITNLVMAMNSGVKGCFVMSSGKNMGVFKGVGYPEDVADFYCIEDYQASLWLGHGRFPTNSPGWWGGAHPFNILGWSVVHNGEISSYDANRRFLEQYSYKCMLLTDTELVAYMLDFLNRKQGLPLELACRALAPPFWDRLDGIASSQAEALRAIRLVYPSAMLNGPFSLIVGTNQDRTAMIGLTDRIKLRPLVAARRGEEMYIASEECGIRSACGQPDELWMPRAGEPVISMATGEAL